MDVSERYRAVFDDLHLHFRTCGEEDPGDCFSRPTCYDLLAPDRGDLSSLTHVCPATGWGSVRFFAEERYPTLLGDWAARYQAEYPLPIGSEAIRAWCRQVFSASGVAVDRGARPNLAGPVPWPIVQQPDAYLGLAVLRCLDVGQVWLLGLVEPIPDEPGKWVCGAPIVQTERWGNVRSEVDPLLLAERALWAWYTKQVLGRKVTGRPSWQEVADPDWERLTKEAEAIRKKHPTLSWTIIAQRVGTSDSNLRRWRNRPRKKP